MCEWWYNGIFDILGGRDYKTKEIKRQWHLVVPKASTQGQRYNNYLFIILLVVLDHPLVLC